jgi:hypothetical protein
MADVKNVNYLAPNTFKFVLHGLEDVVYFLQKVNLPALSIGTVAVPTPTERDYDDPDNKVTYEDLTITFIVDEDINNWRRIADWVVKLAKKQADKRADMQSDLFKDATLHLLTNSSNPNVRVKFRRIFPVSITGLDFDTSTGPDAPMTASVTFKYLNFEVE